MLTRKPHRMFKRPANPAEMKRQQRFSTSMTPEMHKALSDVAYALDTKMAEIVRDALDNYLTVMVEEGVIDPPNDYVPTKAKRSS